MPRTRETPLVRVPFVSKWYRLLVDRGDETPNELVDFPDMGNYETLGSPYVDHAPNPRHVCAWAEKMGFMWTICLWS